MQIIELILLVFSSISILFNTAINKKIKKQYQIGLLITTLLIQLFFEGYRWQMAPTYLLWLIAVINISKQKKNNTKIFFKVIKLICLTLLISIGYIVPSILPVFELPKPRGIYKVGTKLIYSKTHLNETITKDPSDKRELMYKIWYPSNADVSSLNGETYIDQGSRIGFAKKYGLPATALNYLDKIETFVYEKIPIAYGKFPILIFSHGYGSKATGYYALLTELTSQGYIIINMNHTHESLGVTLPNGEKKYFDYDFQKAISVNAMKNITPIKKAFKDSISFKQRHSIIRNEIKNYFEGSIQDRWSNDIIITIDLIKKWNNEGFLKDKLNLDKIGVIGHSVGGGTAGNVAMKDSRIKAVVNLDGIQWGNKIDSLYKIPYLYVSADWPSEHEDVNSHIYLKKSTDYFYETKLLKSGHPNFMDIPFMIPATDLAGTGDIDPYLGMEIITKLTTSFFGKHLKQMPNTEPQRIKDEFDLLEMQVYFKDSKIKN